MSNNIISISKHIEISWHIIGYDNYSFGKDKKLYNLKTGKEIKQTINCYSKGYWIGRKFLTLNKLKQLLIRPKHFGVPF